MKQLQDSATAGHLGPLIRFEGKRFYWVGQHQDVEDWCGHCDACAARKPSVPGHVYLMQPSAIGTPYIAMDIIGLFPQTDKGSAYILVWGLLHKVGGAVLHATWKLHQLLCACMTSFADMGLQTTDQGTNFESGKISELCKSVVRNKIHPIPSLV